MKERKKHDIFETSAKKYVWPIISPIYSVSCPKTNGMNVGSKLPNMNLHYQNHVGRNSFVQMLDEQEWGPPVFQKLKLLSPWNTQITSPGIHRTKKATQSHRFPELKGLEQ